LTRPTDDDYSTPPEAVRALLSVEGFGGAIWEPCAGRGVLADALREKHRDPVYATTLRRDHGRGNAMAGIVGGVDFLKTDVKLGRNVVTNPPYFNAELIIRRAVHFCPVKIAMLLNIKFWAGAARSVGLWRDFPPVRVHVFADRVTMYPASYDGPKGTTTENHAWYIWEWPYHPVPPTLHHLNSRDFR